MAANDYFDSFQRRNDAPLPPVPTSSNSRPPYPESHRPDVSPISSPFDDSSYATNSHTNLNKPGDSYNNIDSSYYGAHSGGKSNRFSNNDTNPFGDQNAIPLQEQSRADHKRHNSLFADEEERRMPRRNRHKKKKGWFSGRVTWVVWIFTIVQVGVFIGELIRNAQLTGTPIAIKPSFNPMIGPSTFVLINMGARFAPCMHNVGGITDAETNTAINWPCPNAKSTDDYTCTLSEACGFGGVPEQKPGTDIKDRQNEPNQWFRFIVPMFLHAGIIHLAFNMLLQVTLGRDMEKLVGSLRFLLVYVCSGIFGFVLGGNYSAPLIASTGASGALFGILALTLIDILYTWRERKSPVRDLMFILLDCVIAFVLGLLPGLDNFSHIGGFLMGLVLGVCILHSPNALRQRTGMDDPPYSSVGTAGATGVTAFARQPLGFFKGRKPFWWAWWGVRAGALVVVLIGFILLLNNFYVVRQECSWCKYLTCLPINNWCELGKPNIIETTTPQQPNQLLFFIKE